MARSVQEIFSRIEAAKNAEPTLAQINSQSVTAIWRLWAFVTAAIIWLHETMFDSYKLDLQSLVDGQYVGSGSWYASALLRFQVGDLLTMGDNGKPVYPVLDPAKRIVARSSFQELPNSLLLLKAAKLVNAALQPLAPVELTQVRGYVARLKLAGVQVSVISEPADLLRVGAEVYYNSLIAPATLRASLLASINAYLAALPFDGTVSLQSVVDAIQRTPGVLDVRMLYLRGVSSLGTIQFDRIYRARAGYIQPDPTLGFTLADTITLFPQ